jgi:tRNA-specific adenosine deaminase 3
VERSALDVVNCMLDLHEPTASSSHRPAPTAPEHLNNTGCKIKYTEGKGRGVYGAFRTLLRSTLD